MKKLIVGVLVLMLTGCENGVIVFSDEARENVKQDTQYRANTRIALFRECMELAAKMPRQSDDDVSDIVSACENTSHYLSSSLTKAKEN